MCPLLEHVHDRTSRAMGDSKPQATPSAATCPTLISFMNNRRHPDAALAPLPYLNRTASASTAAGTKPSVLNLYLPRPFWSSGMRGSCSSPKAMASRPNGRSLYLPPQAEGSASQRHAKIGKRLEKRLEKRPGTSRIPAYRKPRSALVLLTNETTSP